MKNFVQQNINETLARLAYRRSINRNAFTHDLKTCFKELYGITDPQTINTISMNHVVNNLEEYICTDAKLFNFIALLLLKIE